MTTRLRSVDAIARCEATDHEWEGCGWCTGFGLCVACNAHTVDVFPACADATALACGACGAMAVRIVTEETWHGTRDAPLPLP